MSNVKPVAMVILLTAALTLGPGGPIEPLSASDRPVDDGLTQSRGRGKAPKVDVCHVTDDGRHRLININENALPEHLGHGDALPGTGDLDEECAEAPSATLRFTDISASFVWSGAGVFIEWTTEGTSEPVTYTVEATFDGLDWQVVDIVLGTGEGTYATWEFIVFDEYRVRAVTDDGFEVLSPTASPF